jgi:hypothetical protein
MQERFKMRSRGPRGPDDGLAARMRKAVSSKDDGHGCSPLDVFWFEREILTNKRCANLRCEPMFLNVAGIYSVPTPARGIIDAPPRAAGAIATAG